MIMKKLFLSYLLISSFALSGIIAQTQAVDWTMEDLNGNTHSLYADYLDQGTTVFISLAASWNVWDSVWTQSNVMEDFHNEYAGDDAVVLFIEADSITGVAELMGQGADHFDLVTGFSYPIFNAPQDVIDGFNLVFYPSIRIICPDGTMYDDTNFNDYGYGRYQEAEDIAEVMFELCGTSFDSKNRLFVDVHKDDNTDCVNDTGEIGVPNVGVEYSSNGNIITKYTDDTGQSRALLNSGDYTVQAIAPNNLWDVCNNPQDVSFPTTGGMETINFGLQANSSCVYLSTTVSSPRFRRCFDSYIYVTYCNEGTEAADNAYVEVELDDFLEYVDADVMPSSIQGQLLTFDLGTLDPWECETIVIIVLPDCDVDLGTEQCVSSVIYPQEPCDPRNKLFDSECQEIIGAYDPNDKRAFPYLGSDDYTILPDTSIRYQIRFQNTGTDTAFNVVVMDKISENLDLSSFEKLSSSHPCNVEINDARELRFYFDDIMLPDSFVNEPGSNGFVTFRLTMKTGLVNGDQIENFADIFFDFNDPITTNTTVHTVDDGIVSTTSNESNRFKISPNPAKDFITITSENTAGLVTLEILTIAGQSVIVKDIYGLKENIDITSLSSGLYLIKIEEQDGNVSVQKLIIEE